MLISRLSHNHLLLGFLVGGPSFDNFSAADHAGMMQLGLNIVVR